MTSRHFDTRTFTGTCACTTIALFAVGAHAKFVKGDEAVQQTLAGGKRVATPSISAAPAELKLCEATAGCYGVALHMLATRRGLVECAEPYARPGGCRTSTDGKATLSRLWVANVRGRWLKCHLPDLSRRCVPMFARPPAIRPVSAAQ